MAPAKYCAVRSVIQMVDLIKDIRTYSKDSWIINYSNPAAIVAEATKRIFPSDKKIVNICDMPTSVLDAYLPLIGVKRSLHALNPSQLS